MHCNVSDVPCLLFSLRAEQKVLRLRGQTDRIQDEMHDDVPHDGRKRVPWSHHGTKQNRS